jgi:hypothetical protein
MGLENYGVVFHVWTVAGPKPSPTKERRNVVNSVPNNLHEDRLSPVSRNGLINLKCEIMVSSVS